MAISANLANLHIYPLVIEHSHGKSPFLIGKPSINGPSIPWLRLCEKTRGLVSTVFDRSAEVVHL